MYRTLMLMICLLLTLSGLSFATHDKALLYGGAGQGRVIFDGRLHASKGMVCNDCHSAIFETQKKALITMQNHFEDKACFVCHNGKRAFNDCNSCHRKFEAAKTVVKLYGAASVVDSLINPHKAAVEKATGYSLEIVKSNAGKGLIDLADGKCDASLASASVETVAKGAKAAGREVDTSKLQLHAIQMDQVVFVVNPANKVQTLTFPQLKDIHTGKITNWKELGGADQTIKVVTDTLSSATRGLIKQKVLKNEEYLKETLPVNVATISAEVAKDPAAIGGLGAGFVKAGVVVVKTDKIERPLGLITVGPPSEKVRKVIEAYKAAIAK
ncbi:substrate-binding domain-containing protein [Trichlorobacter lovleyi]|uniref:substrate-binding domain-containing protein n=1 Tax=Trichlorobacter lovleyi TaxID=313985 RepID=UPI00223F5AEC|nr:substrate-binding domain-containing protein [Trichlorobacter lovleyi]QOX80492.1 substrate-binding domain-containing protein [Trichlorobacter lovleyi]